MYVWCIILSIFPVLLKAEENATGNVVSLFDKIYDEADNLTESNSKSVGQDIDSLLKANKKENQDVIGPPLKELKKEFENSDIGQTIKAAEEGKNVSKDQVKRFLHISKTIHLHVRMIGDHLKEDDLKKIADEMKSAINELEGENGNLELIKKISDLTKKAKESVQKANNSIFHSLEQEQKKLESEAVPETDEKNYLKNLVVKAKNIYYLIRGLLGSLLGLTNPN